MIVLPMILVGAAGGVAAWLAKRKKDAAITKLPPAKKPPRATPVKPVDPSAPAVQPFYTLVLNPSTGKTALKITDVVRMYNWATHTAIENGAASDSNAADVLMILQDSLPGAGNNSFTDVIIDEKTDGANDDEWSGLLEAAKPYTWGELMAMTEQWLQSKGLA